MAEVRVSGCIITQGAPDLLEACLLDMSDFCDEIIVVDGGADEDTDTRKVADSMPQSVYISNPWPGNISTQRNIYMEAARGEWIFTMDTDERLESNFADDIEDWISEDDIDGACFPRPWRVDETHFVLSPLHYPDFNFRLIRNRQGIFYRDDAEFAVHHSFFGLENPVLFLQKPAIFHDIFIHEDQDARQAKLRLYDEMSSNESGSRFAPYYLYEDHPHHILSLSARPSLEAWPHKADTVTVYRDSESKTVKNPISNRDG